MAPSRRAQLARRKARHRLDPLRYIDPDAARKISAIFAVWFASLFAVQKKASVETASAVDQAQASAAVAVYAAEAVDSLRLDVERMKRRLLVLERAAGGDKLAEARQSIARPQARTRPRPWWRMW